MSRNFVSCKMVLERFPSLEEKIDSLSSKGKSMKDSSPW